jgi:hypothetical protein
MLLFESSWAESENKVATKMWVGSRLADTGKVCHIPTSHLERRLPHIQSLIRKVSDRKLHEKSYLADLISPSTFL